MTSAPHYVSYDSKDWNIFLWMPNDFRFTRPPDATISQMLSLCFTSEAQRLVLVEHRVGISYLVNVDYMQLEVTVVATICHFADDVD